MLNLSFYLCKVKTRVVRPDDMTGIHVDKQPKEKKTQQKNNKKLTVIFSAQ